MSIGQIVLIVFVVSVWAIGKIMLKLQDKRIKKAGHSLQQNAEANDQGLEIDNASFDARKNPFQL